MNVLTRRLGAFLLVGSLLVLGGGATAALASDEGHLAAEQVTEKTYRHYLGDMLTHYGILYTHDGHDRKYGPEHDLARANIVAEFQSFGLDVALEPFTYSGTTYYNVVATKLGTLHPDQEYIVSGHFDSTCYYCDNPPGADDDASGVSTVLEAARILSPYDSDYTIRFIAFDREEQGLYGSSAYVNAHGGDDILGMISCDMMAWDPSTNNASVYGRSTSLQLKNALRAAIAEYSTYQGITLTSVDEGWNGQSDHAPFDAAGYQAVLYIEGEGFNNTHIHSAADSVDTIGYINYPFAVRMTRSIVGYLVDNAGVHLSGLTFQYPNGRPAQIEPIGDVLRVQVSGAGGVVPSPGSGMFHVNAGSGWQHTPMIEVTSNLYDAIFPTVPCGATVLYYISAEDVGGQVFTSPSGAPSNTFSTLAIAGMPEGVFYDNPLSTSPGWTTQDLWAFGHPTGQGGEYGDPDPSNGHTGTNVYGYNLSGDYQNDLPERHLTSTAIDCTGMYGVHLTFWRWLGVEQPLYDHAYVRVSNNGTTWTTIWQNSETMSDTAWQFMDLDVSAVADNQPTVYLRWTMGETDGGWRYCGWNIDDIQLLGITCAYACVGDLGDMDHDGLIDGDDIPGFAAALLGNYDPCADMASPTGTLDMADVQAFTTALLAP